MHEMQNSTSELISGLVSLIGQSNVMPDIVHAAMEVLSMAYISRIKYSEYLK